MDCSFVLRVDILFSNSVLVDFYCCSNKFFYTKNINLTN